MADNKWKIQDAIRSATAKKDATVDAWQFVRYQIPALDNYPPATSFPAYAVPLDYHKNWALWGTNYVKDFATPAFAAPGAMVGLNLVRPINLTLAEPVSATPFFPPMCVQLAWQPAWMAAPAPPNGTYNWQEGDAVVWCADDYYGRAALYSQGDSPTDGIITSGNGQPAVIWTSPLDGGVVVNITLKLAMNFPNARNAQWSFWNFNAAKGWTLIQTDEAQIGIEPYSIRLPNPLIVKKSDMLALGFRYADGEATALIVDFTIEATE